MDQSKDLTTVVLLHVDPQSQELVFIGHNILPGQSQVCVSQTGKGKPLQGGWCSPGYV
jgi:hypothetical protein